jgi:hypothetical protein
MSDPNLQDQLARLVSGYWYTQTIYVAAKLNIAELLKDGPKSAQELAQATGTNPRALYRLLRALASIGIFAEDQGRFTLTPLAECLLDRSTKAMATIRGDFQYRAWGELLYSIQTGQSAFEKVYGKPIFDFFAENPEPGKLFDQAMTGVHGRETGAMLEAYDFTGINTLADIGGGNGSVITAILQTYPAMKGIIFDLPGVTERTDANLKSAGLEHRCKINAGNFFEAVPSGAGRFKLSAELHGQTGFHFFDVGYRLQDVLIVDADSEHAEVVSKRTRDLGLLVEFNICKGDRRNRLVLPVVQTKVPVPVAIERHKALELVTDVLLRFFPI